MVGSTPSTCRKVHSAAQRALRATAVNCRVLVRRSVTVLGLIVAVPIALGVIRRVVESPLGHGRVDLATRRRSQVYYPSAAFCTDNGAMIALAGALRAERGVADAHRE